MALWAVKSLLSTAFSLAARARALPRPRFRCDLLRLRLRLFALTWRASQALLLLAFVAWTITQSSDAAKSAAAAEEDDDEEEDPLATARRIMKKYK